MEQGFFTYLLSIFGRGEAKTTLLHQSSLPSSAFLGLKQLKPRAAQLSPAALMQTSRSPEVRHIGNKALQAKNNPFPSHPEVQTVFLGLSHYFLRGFVCVGMRLEANNPKNIKQTAKTLVTHTLKAAICFGLAEGKVSSRSCNLPPTNPQPNPTKAGKT